MVVGGARPGRTPSGRLDLIDEYRIFVHPVPGRRGHAVLRGAPDALTSLERLETRTFGNGVVLLRHARPRRHDQGP